MQMRDPNKRKQIKGQTFCRFLSPLPVGLEGMLKRPVFLWGAKGLKMSAKGSVH